MHTNDVDAIAVDYPNASYYICGPKGFENMAHEALKNAGIKDNQIFIETFTPAGGPKPFF